MSEELSFWSSLKIVSFVSCEFEESLSTFETFDKLFKVVGEVFEADLFVRHEGIGAEDKFVLNWSVFEIWRDEEADCEFWLLSESLRLVSEWLELDEFEEEEEVDEEVESESVSESDSLLAELSEDASLNMVSKDTEFDGVLMDNLWYTN